MKRSHRIALQAGTVVFFVLFYLLVPDAHERMGTFMYGLFYGLPVLGFLSLFFFLPRYRKGGRLTREGVELLSQGRIAAALEKFEAARPLVRSPTAMTYNIALCQLQLWRLEVVERMLVEVESLEGLRPEFHGQLFPPLALVAALEGRLRPAVQRIDEARARGNAEAPLTLLASAVVACRTGRWAEARALLERQELRKLEGPLGALGETLRAWSLWHLTQERVSVDPISVFGEASPDSLKAAWPELVDFLLERARPEPSQLPG